MKKNDLIKFSLKNIFYYLLFSFSFLTQKVYSQQTYSFTAAGATGSVGPLQTQINTAYASTNLNGSVVATNGIQSFTVPFAGLYLIDASGASAGSSTVSPFNAGGSGSRMQGEFLLAQGDVIKIVVGQKGLTGTTGSGGGGSYVINNNILLIAAGGGGGGTADQLGAHSVTTTAGTNDNPNGPSAGGVNGNGGLTCNTGVNNPSAGGGYLTNGANGSNLNGGVVTGGLAFLNGSAGGSGPLQGGFGGRWCRKYT